MNGGEISMPIINNKIELTPEEKKNFVHELKKGILFQLHNEKLLTCEQINQILKSI